MLPLALGTYNSWRCDASTPVVAQVQEDEGAGDGLRELHRCVPPHRHHRQPSWAFDLNNSILVFL